MEIRSLAAAKCTSEVESALRKLELGCYRSFYLFSVDLESGVRVFVWDGRQLTPLAEPPAILTTSSCDAVRVVDARTSQFEGLGVHPTRSDHLDYHHSHNPEDTAASVRMRREDAQTVSFSEIRVNGVDRTVEFRYRPEPVDSLEILEETRVPLPLNKP